MNIIIDTTGWPSPADLIARQQSGTTITTIAAELGVSRYKVFRYLKGFRPAGKSQIVDREMEAFERNARFIEAMCAAIRSGAETAKFEIKTDSTPLVPKLFHREAAFSGCGSPAAQCVFAADSEEVAL